MTVSHIQQRQFAISRVPQVDYATPTAASVSQPLGFVEMLVKDKNLAAYQVHTRDNKGYSTRNDFPTEQWTLSHDVTRNVEFEPASDALGRLLLLALGSVDTSQPDASGAPTAYSHLFKPQDANLSRQLPVTTLVEQVGAGVNALYPSCVVEKMSIKGEGVDRVASSFSFRGSGKRITPSNVNFTPGAGNQVIPATGLKYFFNSQVALTVADAGTLGNATQYGTAKRLESWEINIENQLLADDGFRPGSTDFQNPNDQTSGAVRSECLFGERAITGSFVVRVSSSSDEYAALLAQKPLDFKIVLTGPAIAAGIHHSLAIESPLMAYEAIDYGDRNGIVTLQIKPKFLYDVTTGRIIEFTLVNETESYL
jgi:hypothetical protein